MTLCRNPHDYFAEVEQLAFSPSNLVPGIEPSPDKLLQGRLFSYPDAQRHRLGPNFHLLPVNKATAVCPKVQVIGGGVMATGDVAGVVGFAGGGGVCGAVNFNRDGAMMTRTDSSMVTE